MEQIRQTAEESNKQNQEAEFNARLSQKAINLNQLQQQQERQKERSQKFRLEDSAYIEEVIAIDTELLANERAARDNATRNLKGILENQIRAKDSNRKENLDGNLRSEITI